MKTYTPEEAATMLQVTPETIRRWARAGKLSGSLLSGSIWRFTDEDLTQFIEVSRPRRDKRAATGIELLRVLRQEGVLYFHTSRGNIENKKFKTELFRDVIREAEYITCQNGRRIAVRSLFKQHM